MDTMTSRERIQRMFEHREADRIPLSEGPWGATLERWRREGLGDGDYGEFFGLDRIMGVGVDNSPRFPGKTLEETDEYRVFTTGWGAKMKDWKHAASVPEMLDVTIKDADSWRAAKARMTPTDDRINWDYLKQNFPVWRERGAWINGGGWFGFDITHAWAVGTERCLVALAEDPEWLVDMWQTELDLNLTLLDRVWDQGYRFDSLCWPDDMGYKHNQFFSLAMYRRLLKPIHQQAIDWAHAKGIKAMLHSCGDISPFIPDLVAMGIDYLNPIEVKAGLDPIAIKRQFGDRLVLHGGINALTWADVDRMAATVREVVPILKEGGGYIFGTDHSTPSNVSLEDFRRIINLVKEVGSYGAAAPKPPRPARKAKPGKRPGGAS